MSILVSEILTKVSLVLIDEGFARWEKDELIGWINDATAEIINLRPAALSQSITFTLVQGTLQKLTDDYPQLLDVVRNINATTGAPGRPVSIMDRKLMDDSDPDWHSGTPSSTILNYTHDLRVPREFYVYPPAVAGSKLECIVTKLPPVVTAEGNTLEMGREYIPAITHYVCYRAMSKDSEYANGQVAAAFYSAFAGALTGQAQTAQANGPESAST